MKINHFELYCTTKPIIKLKDYLLHSKLSPKFKICENVELHSSIPR